MDIWEVNSDWQSRHRDSYDISKLIQDFFWLKKIFLSKGVSFLISE